MGGPTVTMRCPSCGTELQAVLAPAPPTQWFPCPNCHTPVPFVLPRELPPLYTWEVVPGLYPPVSVPRRWRFHWRSVVSVALAAAAVLSAATAGLLVADGYLGAQPATYVVSGTVFEERPGGSTARVLGAHVVLFTNDNQSVRTTTTNVSGDFSFAGVPNGGIELNVTAPGSGYAPTVVYTFACPSYSAGTTGLDVTLSTGGPSNTTTVVLSPYGDLGGFLTYVGSGAVLLVGVTIAAGLAALAIRRPGGSVAAVVGSGAAIAAPAVVLLFSLDEAFPVVATLGAVAGGLGAFALVLSAGDLASGGDRPASA
jgi:Carboxypeptidase regulatory-like domain